MCRPLSPSLANGTRSVPATFRKTYSAHRDLDSETSPHLERMLSRKNLLLAGSSHFQPNSVTGDQWDHLGAMDEPVCSSGTFIF